jgi:hypothetical protein
MITGSTTAILILGYSPRVSAQAGELLPVAQLAAVFPQGAQVGTTAELTFVGQHLDGPNSVHFSGGGFEWGVKLDKQGNTVANTFVIQVPLETQPGVYEVRLQGKFGLSNPRQFVVGRLPEVVHAKPSTDQATPIEIHVDSTINTAAVSGNRCWFQIALRESQEVFLYLNAPDSRAEPIVTVRAPDGAVVMRGRLPTNNFEFHASQAGAYRIEIHDLLFRGGDEFRFRLTVSSEPVVAPSLHSLANAELSQLERFRIDELNSPNASNKPGSEAISTVAIPFEHTGLFPPRGQPIRFLFSAKAGDVYWIEVVSHRLGYATDATLVIEREENKPDGPESYEFLSEAADIEYTASAAGFGLDSRDGRIRFEAPQDGRYRISLRDAFNTHDNSPRLPYRLVVRKPQPDFDLIAVPDQGPRNRPVPTSINLLPLALRRGGVASTRVFVQRQDGFAADIALSADGLPEGVTCLGAVLGPGDECASLTFYASDDAQSWAGKIRVEGRALHEGQELIRLARAVTPIWNVKDTRQDLFRARQIDAIGLAVIAEQAPVLLEPVNAVIEAHPKEKIPIKLKVTRRGGYDQIVNVRPFVLGDQGKSVLSDHTLPKDVAEVTLELDLAKFDVKPGEHSFVFHGFADKIQYIKSTADGKTEKPKDMSFALFSKPIRIKILADTETKSLSEKGSDPLRRGKKPNEIDSPLKGQTPFRIGSK